MIRNIIFDLGGVLIPLNMKATSDAFIKLGATDFDTVYSKNKQQAFFDLFDKGVLSAEAFRQEIKKHLHSGVTDEQVDNAWNAMLALIPVEKINFLSRIAGSYSIYLLSNTNSIHVEKFERDHLQYYGRDIFATIFKRVYYSCRLNMRKPDKEIFDYVIHDNQLQPHETLFIDDTQQHVNGALKSGLQSVYLDLNTHSVETLISEFLPGVNQML